MYEILLVDDHTHLVDSLAISLPWGDMGITAVHKAYSGEEALELLGYRAIDIIVTDIQMNGMSGLELIACINGKRRNVKTVILTGHDEFQYAKEALQQRVSDYLLKPVPNEDMERTIRKLIGEIEQEGKQRVDQQKIAASFRESLPKLRESLLLDLLAGEQMPRITLLEKLELYRLSFALSEPATLLCVRIEEDYAGLDLYSVSLLEYALCNIAEEVFAERYRVWLCRDPYDYLIMLVQPQNGAGNRAADGNAELEDLARYAQRQAKLYLKMKVSVVVSQNGLVPRDLTAMYQATLSTYTDFIGYQTESFLNVVRDQETADVRPLSALYAPPTLLQLIDVEQWSAFEKKLETILDEWDGQSGFANENGFEIYASLLQAFIYYVHKKGKGFFEVFGRDLDRMLKAEASWSAVKLREWAYSSFRMLKAGSDSRSDHLRQNLMERVYRYVAEQLSEVTLQAVADYVHLHPVYVSNLFKQESGENFSSYVLRLRMDKAAQLLRNKDLRISQIALEVGYQKPQYFIKLFKTHYGMTPQEFKNNL